MNECTVTVTEASFKISFIKFMKKPSSKKYQNYNGKFLLKNYFNKIFY